MAVEQVRHSSAGRAELASLRQRADELEPRLREAEAERIRRSVIGPLAEATGESAHVGGGEPGDGDPGGPAGPARAPPSCCGASRATRPRCAPLTGSRRSYRRQPPRCRTSPPATRRSGSHELRAAPGAGPGPDPEPAQRALPGHQRRAADRLARRGAAGTPADGAVPLRRLATQAVLRRQPRRDRVHATPRTQTAFLTGATRMSASRSRCSTTAGSASTPGFCTDRLATVFRAGQEPFVAPSGGRMDEIIRAVRDCPSGALSYALDGVEARDGGRPPRHARAGDRGVQGRAVPDHRRASR